MFGDGKPRPLARNAKLRIMALARVLMRRTAKGKHYGAITAKHYMVLQRLLWDFHNAATGLCFPSLDTIAEKVGCCRRTVADAIKALEKAGLLTWVNRIKRVYMDGRWRVLRTSNGYRFNPPPDVQATKCNLTSGTAGQAVLSSLATPVPTPTAIDSDLAAALGRLGKAVYQKRLFVAR